MEIIDIMDFHNPLRVLKDFGSDDRKKNATEK